MTRYEWLLAKVDEEIGRFDAESKRHKAMFRWLRYAGLGFTMAAAVLASLSMVSGDGSDASRWCQFGVVVVTSFAGLLASVEGIRKPSELWLIERTIFHALCDLKRELEFAGPEGMSEEELAGRFAAMQQILSSSQQRWSQIIQKKEPPPASKGDAGGHPAGAGSR